MFVKVQVITGPQLDAEALGKVLNHRLAIAAGFICQIDPADVRVEGCELKTLTNGEWIMVEIHLYPNLDDPAGDKSPINSDLVEALHSYVLTKIRKANLRLSVTLLIEVHQPTLVSRWIS